VTSESSLSGSYVLNSSLAAIPAIKGFGRSTSLSNQENIMGTPSKAIVTMVGVVIGLAGAPPLQQWFGSGKAEARQEVWRANILGAPAAGAQPCEDVKGLRQRLIAARVAKAEVEARIERAQEQAATRRPPL
jgi:hypothetical protein